MSRPIRGRALIINIENFSGKKGKSLQRKGSTEDVYNMRQMLDAFKFDVDVKQDITAQVGTLLNFNRTE